MVSNRIEMHLVVGHLNAICVGSKGYVKFTKHDKVYWMYATLEKLTCKKAIFSVNASKKRLFPRKVKLLPIDILQYKVYSSTTISLDVSEETLRRMREEGVIIEVTAPEKEKQ